jgi:acyl-CoA reductase-like NAD-dependent aldehyde dehydrogenase
MKVAPALLAGNTVVAKPSPYTPLSSLALAAAVRDVVPHGVLNVVGGDDDVGAALCAHPGVRRISMTGSIAAGKSIMRGAANDLKRITLELGGNDPAIVLPDADVGAIAGKIFWNAFANAGQICMAIKRVYVHQDVHAPLVSALVDLARGVTVGDGFDPDAQMGPVSNRRQFERVVDLVDDARQHGGRVVTGGAPLPRPGYFYPPTIVIGVTDGLRLVDEEQFGPVLPVIPFLHVDDAVARANRTHYGLSGSVWTADVARGEAIARRLECGTAWVNQHMELRHEAPFGGMKWSGIGRENGRWGIDEYCELQVLSSTRL